MIMKIYIWRRQSSPRARGRNVLGENLCSIIVHHVRRRRGWSPTCLLIPCPKENLKRKRTVTQHENTLMGHVQHHGRRKPILKKSTDLSNYWSNGTKMKIKMITFNWIWEWCSGRILDLAAFFSKTEHKGHKVKCCWVKYVRDWTPGVWHAEAPDLHE